MPHLVEWAAALESDEYEQAEGTLIRPGVVKKLSYCCLGVAAKICPFVELRDDTTLVYKHNEEEIELDDGELDSKVLEWLGIDHAEQSEYITMNDEQSYTFKKIAGEIRKRHPETFA